MVVVVVVVVLVVVAVAVLVFIFVCFPATSSASSLDGRSSSPKLGCTWAQ
jgi:hypothetical protein